MPKRIVFLTGTRADFGKLKSLIMITQNSSNYETHIFATGMHLNSKYGKTVDEIEKSGFSNIFCFINHDAIENMDRTLAKTIDGFSHYVAEMQPDLIVVHGDRCEAMAGAIVGSLNNILVAHVEGGEVSGTIDELIRHAVSKMSHIHFVANDEAKCRLLQLGEIESSIHVIGSPDLDLMSPRNLPPLDQVKKHYQVDFKDYSLAMFHPVTTEYQRIRVCARNYVDALINSNKNYIVIYPNNDMGSKEIMDEYRRFDGLPNFKIFPSLRFEYFLTLLKNSDFIVGNSSAGIREAPFYNVPAIDIGTRQNNRSKAPCIFHCDSEAEDILSAIEKAKLWRRNDLSVNSSDFGHGKSDKMFFNLLEGEVLWGTKCQKQFQEM